MDVLTKVRNSMTLAQLQALLDTVYARLGSANTFTTTTEATKSIAAQIINGGLLVKKKIYSNSSINVEGNPSTGGSTKLDATSLLITDSGGNTFLLDTNDGLNLILTVTGTAVGLKVPKLNVTSTTTLGGNITVGNGINFILNTSTGTKIGTGTNQKLGFYNKTPIAQQANTAGAVTASGSYTSTEQAMLNDCYSLLRNIGLLS